MISSRSSPSGKLAFLAVMLFGALYMWHMLVRGWVPHDEGALAQSAERILQGQLPHRDFTEIYTGGLSYLNALAFRIWGIRLFSMRLMLYMFFLLWLPVLFYVYRRVTGTLGAAAFTLLAVTWSVPNYASPIPSWYNLFFTTFSVAALMRYQHSRRRHWLIVAGGLAGASCLFKIVGLYLVAASVFYLIFVEQDRSEASQSRVSRVLSLQSALVVGAALVFIAAVIRLLRARMGGVEVVHFLLPAVAIAAVVVGREWKVRRLDGSARFAFGISLLVPYLVGVVLPCAAFMAYYWGNGALEDLWLGVLVKPFIRLAFATKRPAVFWAYVPTLVLAATIWVSSRFARRVSWAATAVAAFVAATVLLMPASQLGYLLTWHALYHVPPFIVCGAAVWLLAASDGDLTDRQHLMLATSVLGTAGLIQFPFAAPIYFAYISPLLFLVILCVLKVSGRVFVPTVSSLVGFYMLFAVLRVTPGFIYDMGIRPALDKQTQMLPLPRAGLRVAPGDAKVYSEVIETLRVHASGRFIYASPDAPEVYFLAGFSNPTGTLFDFFDPDETLTTNILKTLRQKAVAAVVVNSRPAFSSPMPVALLDSLATMYPNAVIIERFIVRW